MAVQRRPAVSSCLDSIPTYLIVLFLLLGFHTNGVFSEGEITGFRIESIEQGELEKGRAYVYADHDVDIRLFGRGFKSGSQISFTLKSADRNTNCQDLRTTEILQIRLDNEETGVVMVKLKKLQRDSESYFFCLREHNVTADSQFIHQGSESWLQVGTKIKPSASRLHLLPQWLMIVLVVILLIFSGLCSGLNLGLMSLDKTELDIMINSGTPQEKKYAEIIRPVRRHGNLLLCSILLGNVLINSSMTVVLEDLTGSGLIAISTGTLAIVTIGEIIPQAICSRFGLLIGAKTIWFTKSIIFLTFVLSYPYSRILDCVLGEEIGRIYNRERLRELIHLTERDLNKEEVNIITGALELSKKNVSDIMTNLEDVFMLDITSVLDFETMNMIMKNGYSRIPVYEKDKQNIVGLFNIKDLAFVDPDDRMPLRTVLKFYNHPVIFVLKDTPLDVMLQDFKKGHSHLAVVQKVKSEGVGDPFYEPLGLVTLEDIIEEIIQAEIVDETDVISDNRKRLPRKTLQRDFSAFSHPDDDNNVHLSPQLALAAYQFLSTSVAPFRPELISENVLQKLMRQNIIVNLHLTNPPSPECYIYTSGRPCDYFVLILQGRVEVEFVKDSIVFEGGPFAFFGIQTLQALSTNSWSDLHKNPGDIARSAASLNATSTRRQSIVNFVPDFSVRAISDLQYMRISRAQYIVATSATLMERRPQSPPGSATILDDKFRMSWQRFEHVNNPTVATSNLNAALENNSSTQNLDGGSTLPDKTAEHNNVNTVMHSSTSHQSLVSFAAGTQAVKADSKIDAA